MKFLAVFNVISVISLCSHGLDTDFLKQGECLGGILLEEVGGKM